MQTWGHRTEATEVRRDKEFVFLHSVLPMAMVNLFAHTHFHSENKLTYYIGEKTRVLGHAVAGREIL